MGRMTNPPTTHQVKGIVKMSPQKPMLLGRGARRVAPQHPIISPRREKWVTATIPAPSVGKPPPTSTAAYTAAPSAAPPALVSTKLKRALTNTKQRKRLSFDDLLLESQTCLITGGVVCVGYSVATYSRTNTSRPNWIIAIDCGPLRLSGLDQSETFKASLCISSNASCLSVTDTPLVGFLSSSW